MTDTAFARAGKLKRAAFLLFQAVALLIGPSLIIILIWMANTGFGKAALIAATQSNINQPTGCPFLYHHNRNTKQVRRKRDDRSSD